MDILTLIALGMTLMLAIAFVLLARKQSQLHDELMQNQLRIEQLTDELNALHAGAAGQVGHIARIEEQVHHLSDKQEQLDIQDPTSQSYSEAIELIQRGASAEELMRRGLRREEADLLMRLHGHQALG